jgi:hypothetical protein
MTSSSTACQECRERLWNAPDHETQIDKRSPPLRRRARTCNSRHTGDYQPWRRSIDWIVEPGSSGIFLARESPKDRRRTGQDKIAVGSDEAGSKDETNSSTFVKSLETEAAAVVGL